MSDWQQERQRFQESVSLHHLEFDVLEETFQKASSLIRENRWDEHEGLVIIFANGLEYLRSEATLSRVNHEGSEAAAKMAHELQRTVAQLLEESSKYAALKFRTYRFSLDNQTLEMHENALRGELAMYEQTMKVLRQEAEQMQARIRELEAENRRLKALLPQANVEALPGPKEKKSLLSHLKWWEERSEKPVVH